MYPLIRDDQPTRLPFRGPLDQPASASTPQGIQQILDENNQLLLLAEEALNGKIQAKDGSPADVKDAVPFLERLQRNLVYLAVLADQKPAAASTGRDPMNAWTPEEVEKLRGGVMMYGENAEALAMHVGSKSVEAIQQCLEQWRRKAF